MVLYSSVTISHQLCQKPIGDLSGVIILTWENPIRNSLCGKSKT